MFGSRAEAIPESTMSTGEILTSPAQRIEIQGSLRRSLVTPNSTAILSDRHA